MERNRGWWVEGRGDGAALLRCVSDGTGHWVEGGSACQCMRWEGFCVCINMQTTRTHRRTDTHRQQWGWWGKGRPINIYWHSRGGEWLFTSGNKRQRMRSCMPGNLLAAGVAPRLCPHGKQEKDRKTGRRREKGQEERDEWCRKKVYRK